MRRRRLTAQYTFFWEVEIQIPGAARVFAANSVATFFFVEMTTIGPLIEFTPKVKAEHYKHFIFIRTAAVAVGPQTEDACTCCYPNRHGEPALALSSHLLRSSGLQPALPFPLASPINLQPEPTHHPRHNNHHLCLLEHYADTATYVLGPGLVRGCCVLFKTA